MTSVEEDFEGFRKAASILSNPLYLQAAKIAELDNYQERQRTYHNQERTLSQPCIDQLIRSIASGHNSYQDLQQKVPDINSPTMCAYIVTAFKDDPKRPASPMSLTSLRFANQSRDSCEMDKNRDRCQRSFIFIRKSIKSVIIMPIETRI